MIHDTEHRRIEALLARYRLLSEHTRDIVLFIRPNGQIVEANQAAVDAYGQAAPDSSYAEGLTKRYGAATTVRAFDGRPAELTEMDAMVAYLQILGRLTDAAHKPVAENTR